MDVKIDQFGGLLTTFNGDGPPNSSSDNLNVRLETGRILPRYGYRNVAAPQGSFNTANLFKLVSGYSGNTFVQEGLLIAKVAGVVKPYSVDLTTGAQTEITSSGTSLSLPDTTYVAEVFQDTVYITGSTDPTHTYVYSHKIGTINDWNTVQDTTYTPPASSALLTVTALQPDARGQSNTDTTTITLIGSAGITGGITFAQASGVLTVSANAFNRVGQHRTQVDIVPAATVDWSGYDYIAFKIDAGVIYNTFERTSIAPSFKYGGTWHQLASTEFQEYFSVDTTEVTILVRIKGIGGSRSAIQGYRYVIGGSTTNTISGTVTAFTMQPVVLGGTYLEATALGHRLWDGNLDGDGITYGVRYKITAGPVYGALQQYSITAGQGHGYTTVPYSGGVYMGGRINLSTPIATSGGYDAVEFVRLMEDGTTWKIIGTVSNTGTPQFTDIYEESELSALTTATSIGVGAQPPAPPFTGKGMTGLFSAFGHMGWLRGTQIEYSTWGVPLSLYVDPASGGPSYTPTDKTNPARFILADNYADSAVGAIQAGRVGVIILGKKAAYAQKGTEPGTIGGVNSMTDSGIIRGSRGCAGSYAFSEYMTPDGTEGVVYVDPKGRVWFIPNYTITSDKGLGAAQVSEISEGNIHTVWDWLVTAQRLEFGYTDLSMVQVVFRKDDGALLIQLGKHAVRLQKVLGKTAPDWIKDEYTLTVPPGQSYVTTLTSYSDQGATAGYVPVANNWSNPTYAIFEDGNFATCGPLPLGSSTVTDVLYADGFQVPSFIPASATITDLYFEVARLKSGDLGVTETMAQFRKSAANFGSDHNVSAVLTTSETVQEYHISSGLPSVADLNSYLMGIQFQWRQESSHADWNNPAKWNIVVTGATNASMTITATYTGAGTVPSYVFVNVSSSVATTAVAGGGGPTTFNMSMDCTVNDGLNGTAGTISCTGLPGSTTPGTVTIADTWRVKVNLSGGTGNTTVIRSGGGVLTSGTGWIPSTAYTGSAALSSYVLSTVQVNDIAMRVKYTVPSAGASTGVSWKFLSFASPNKLWGVRSTGHVDELHFDTSANQWIEGINRDGGYTMSAPYWQTCWIRPAPVSFLGGALVEKGTRGEAVTFSALTDRNGVLQVAPPVKDSFKYGMRQQGKSHQIRLTISESTTSINAVIAQFTGLSTQYTK